MEVGKYTYGHDKIKIMWSKCGNLKIGNFCSIADNVTVFLGGDHSVDWITTYPFGKINLNVFNNNIDVDNRINSKRKMDVTIGNDVWIGGDVTIMRGITIGDGSVIARNSHVVENVKPYSVVGGNPSKFYYYRFDQEIIQKLLNLKWWNLDDSVINELLPYLCSNDFNNLFKFCERNYGILL